MYTSKIADKIIAKYTPLLKDMCLAGCRSIDKFEYLDKVQVTAKYYVVVAVSGNKFSSSKKRRIIEKVLEENHKPPIVVINL